MIKRLLALIAGLAVAGCGGAVKTTEVVRYDFGKLGGGNAASAVPIAVIDVQAASWLAGTDIHFRLGYAEPLRRQSYANSRWAAPPAELLESFLKRRVLFTQSEFAGAGCRLQLVLDEFEQDFETPQASASVLELRATLTAPRAGEPVSRRVFRISKAAPEATARGAAVAAGETVRALADDLGGWLDELARNSPALPERCRSR